MPTQFVHLRAKTAYSFGASVAKTKALAAHCASLGQPAIGICDSDNLHSAVELRAACLDKGVQPIQGCELSHDGSVLETNHAGHKMALLATNETGWSNLVALVARAHDARSSNQPEPKLPKNGWAGRTEGLIALTGGKGSELRKLITSGNLDGAQTCLLQLVEMFGDRLYVEIQRHGSQEEGACELELIRLADEHNVPIVATAEVLYINPEDATARDLLECIISKRLLNDPDRPRLPNTHHLASAEEMAERFKDLPDALENAVEIARRCSYILEKQKPRLPSVADNENEHLRQEAQKGLQSRIPDGPSSVYQERLETELQTIIKCGFSGYFLIVADYVGWSRKNGIPVGPGRGSGAGSLVAWCLGITDLDPVKHGLLFERFLNPERVSLPDFDVDFCQDRRDEVLAYIFKRFGEERVAKIVTYSNLKERAAVRDAGRVLGLHLGLVEKVAKLIPNNPNKHTTLQEAIDQVPELQELVASDEKVRRLLDAAKSIVGLPRGTSEHAAGVVIADRTLEGNYPVFRAEAGGQRVTMQDMKSVEDLGLVKFDVLGLRNLTIIKEACKLARASGPEKDPELASMTLDDDRAFSLLRRGDTFGVFQMAGDGITRAMRDVAADNFEDIVAVVALYRPGPMKYIPDYVAVKRREQKPDYMDPTLEQLLKPTHGIMVYQEQVMQAAQIIAGYTLGGADVLRRAMGKKLKSEMDAQRERFISGAQKQGVSEEKANEIFAKIEKFAEYGFNRSHAAAYGVITYQTAWLKAVYPLEFIIATMNGHMGNKEEATTAIDWLRQHRHTILPPCVQTSLTRSSVEVDTTGKVGRLGLGFIANLGGGAEAIVQERETNGPFKSVADFCKRLSRLLNKRQIEGLVKAGALDALESNRARALQQANRGIESQGGHDLFGDGSAETDPLPWTASETLAAEKETLGFTLAPHPLERWMASAPGFGIVQIAEVEGMASLSQKLDLTLWGEVDSVKKKTTKQGKDMVVLTLRDLSGTTEIAFFEGPQRDVVEQLTSGELIMIRGNASRDEKGLRIRPRSVRRLADAICMQADRIVIGLHGEEALDVADTLKEKIEKSTNGATEVVIEVRTREWKCSLPLPNRVRLKPEILETLISRYSVQAEAA